ncbi:MAG: UvrD-helicase domain-containing protein [Desulfovibrio sp.]|jgi:ATP-dependent exoDNAse (exonuclease V) beta subunit|nr:UvrD-helicase domain-containing protein [Desulfovibrio sp.]
MITRIKASAGSGKTYTLTKNFIELLYKADPDAPSSACALHGRLDGYALQEILAATFTNKAAAEMKDRVLSTLKLEALQSLAATQDTRRASSPAALWVERILRRYGSLNIRTIDSLLTTLVRLSALELNLPPDFEPSFDAAEYFTPYYDSLMEDLAADECENRFSPGADAAVLRAALHSACKSLLSFGNMRGFTLGSRLHDPLLELVELALLGKPLPMAEEGEIYARINGLHKKCKASCAELLERIAKEKLSVNAHYLNFLRACAQSAPGEAPPSGASARKNEFDDCLNKASKGAASEETLQAFARARDAGSAYAAMLAVLRHALQLAPLCRLAGELHARMKADKKAKLLPALLMPRLTAGLMSGETGVSDALCRLGTRISRILLDEFQDTSREQWKAILPLALEALSTGGRLYLVGDAKQAIYGWRGGDAGLFDEIAFSRDLLAVAPDPETLFLKENRRSHPLVIAHNNAFFSLPAQPETAAAVMDALLPDDTPAAYRRAAAEETVNIFSGSDQKVPPEKNWDADPRSSGAEVVLYNVEGKNAEAVENAVRRRLHRLFTEELPMRWKPGDIAVLVRAGDEAEFVAGLLTQWKIPVVTENSFRLFEHPLVGKLVSFLAFLDYPPDDAAFMEFISGSELAGGYTGHDPQALLSWAAESAFSHAPPRPPLYSLFRSRFPALWASLIEPFYAEAGLMSAYDLLAEITARFDLEKRRAEDRPFVRRLLELARLAEQQGLASPATFLAFCRKRGADEKLPMPENMNAVRVMTIHKAKGLEFPVVVIPFQHKQTPHSLKIVQHTCLGLDLMTREVRELPDLHYPARIRAELERLNLLYVAWTRPVYALHAFLTNPGTRPARALKLLVDIYREKYGDRFCRLENPDPEDDAPADRDAAPPGDTDACGESSPCPLPPLPWRPMEHLPRLKIFRSQPLAGADDIRQKGGGDPGPRLTARERGILAHLCLERLHLPRGQDAGAVYEAVGRAVDCGLRLFPPPLEQAEDFAAELRAALLRFAALPDAAAWLACGLREHGIMDEQGNVYRTDLLVDLRALGHKDEEGGGLLVLDYKSGELRESHMLQVRNYMRLLAGASGRPTRGLIFYLDRDLLLDAGSCAA